ncbi:MAG: NAD(P)/FAD-dependent oxidoreductase [Candidatus Omnitrophica bacterium]|nr:NAD(P)/FAD-dependent oxidoreductase [Candidatus Omnitrophota bacterium]
MTGIDVKKYDALIIGAGIGGLVCGCYLAQARKKVLIIEKNIQPGGYCMSFSFNGFHFDKCAHSLGSLRHNGNIGRILDELELKDKIIVERHDPSNIIITPHYNIKIWNSLNKTIDEFQKNFPEERDQIKKFFKFLEKCSGLSLFCLIKIPFDVLLDRYFKNKKLKAVISLPLLGNVGLPASRISSFTAVTLYKEFMIDGGYYPKGGMGDIAEALSGRFKEMGGEIIFSQKVKRILIENRQAKGVSLQNDDCYFSQYVISDIDARQTFIDLIKEKDQLDKDLIADLKNMTPSLSAFILYLGVNKDFKGLPASGHNIWYLPNYGLEELYSMAIKKKLNKLEWFLFRVGTDRKSIFALVNAPYVNKRFWQDNKQKFMKFFINGLEKAIPDLAENIVYKSAATPITLSNWTMNHQGSAYGWEPNTSQIAKKGFSQTTCIKNLYLTGHWSTLAQGVPGVSYLGRSTANIIIKRAGFSKRRMSLA